MGKVIKKLTGYTIVFVIAVVILNFSVTMKQGVNGEVSTIRIPLYAKMCGFFYRDYQYKALAHRITEGLKSGTDRVKAVYDWTVENIRKPPKGFRIIDDHIWDIIVRGYGTGGQVEDVFTTLASYAGYDAFWQKLSAGSGCPSIILSFVKIDSTWYIFSVSGRRPFMNTDDLSKPTPSGPAYSDYLKTMDEAIFKSSSKRPDRQKFFPRIIQELKKFFQFPKKTRIGEASI